MTITVDGIPVSGSVGATTYARNRYGAYKRRRVKGVNPNSAAQQLVRSSLRDAITCWTNTLTAGQRLAWKTYADNVPMLNKAGQTIRLSAQAMFVRFYTFYAYNFFGAPTNLDAPTIFDLGSLNVSIGNFTHDISANTVAFTLSAPQVSNDWNVEDGAVFVRLTPPANPSTAFRPSRAGFAAYNIVGATPTDNISMTTGSPPPFAYGDGQIAWAWVRALGPDNRLTQPQLVGPRNVVDVP